ncbi:LacI family DNA-binding transcriptional regulator [Microlunatus soli]|uniref:Transcriptional regulator, LacI family n=1 Tax=Microlunatus soli TaxID=630515 RepID=A0A1H1ZNA7_9ACTN|nr:LacI family DNA-binding transcriptional regulator [Microlunatus soli]SDT35184.1 transcriptional regulator, LacI family [Microlunatus soli]
MQSDEPEEMIVPASAPDAATAASADAPQRRRRPRLEDVSAATGVSNKTVSRALRGDPKVRDSTRQRIIAEADRLGFQMNDVAAGLRRKNQSMTTIGVTLGDCSNPFFAPMLRGIHSVAAEHGYLVLSADAQNDPDLEHRAIRSFFAHRVAGLIIAPIGNDLGYLANEAAFGSAIVFVDSPPPGLGESMDSVTTTNTSSTREGIDHLLARGHRRIAYLGHPRGGSGAEERWAGYLEALDTAGLTAEPELVRHDLITESDARQAAEELLGTARPDAIFVDNNRLCTGLLQSPAFAARRLDVVSFDRFPLAASFGISVIDSDPYDVGREGAQLLFDRLAEPGRPPQRHEVPARLIVHHDPSY